MNYMVLDIGCGTGFFTQKFKGSVGLDISPENLAIAKKLLPDKEFVIADASHLPFRDGCFENVTLLEVLEHVPDPKTLTQEVYRCLKKDGKYLISFDVYAPSSVFIDPLIMLLMKKYSTELGHKKTQLSDGRTWLRMDQNKVIELLSDFKIVWIGRCMGFAVNILFLIFSFVEKITRRNYSESMGAQYSRVSSVYSHVYIKFLKLFIESICKRDPFKWDSSRVHILMVKQKLQAK